MMTRLVCLTVFSCAILFSLASDSRGDAPPRTIFVGRALTSNLPLTGTYAVTAAVYDAATAGTLLYQETQSSVPISDGAFQMVLGASTASVGTWGPTVFQSSGRWLELTVNQGVMSPRLPFSSVPFAITTQATTHLQGKAFADIKAAAPVGDQGPAGAPGAPGPTGPSLTTTGVCTNVQATPCQAVAQCNCPTGKTLISRVSGICRVVATHTPCSAGICCVGSCASIPDHAGSCCLCQD